MQGMAGHGWAGPGQVAGLGGARQGKAGDEPIFTRGV